MVGMPRLTTPPLTGQPAQNVSLRLLQGCGGDGEGDEAITETTSAPADAPAAVPFGFEKPRKFGEICGCIGSAFRKC